jgi:hypothetical protein
MNLTIDWAIKGLYGSRDSIDPQASALRGTFPGSQPLEVEYYKGSTGNLRSDLIPPTH